MLKPGDPAPPFDLPCALDDQVIRISLAKIRSEMVVLFFYPHDFSFICPTEVIGFHKAEAAFKAERASIVGVSVDDNCRCMKLIWIGLCGHGIRLSLCSLHSSGSEQGSVELQVWQLIRDRPSREAERGCGQPMICERSPM